MSPVELSRPLEAYFAHAEIEASDAGRRFTITLPYFDGARLCRLQWWWLLTPAQLRIRGEDALAQARRTATVRFSLHIEHWLTNNELRLLGEGFIPDLVPNRVRPAGHQVLPERSSGSLARVSNDSLDRCRP